MYVYSRAISPFVSYGRVPFSASYMYLNLYKGIELILLVILGVLQHCCICCFIYTAPSQVWGLVHIKSIFTLFSLLPTFFSYLLYGWFVTGYSIPLLQGSSYCYSSVQGLFFMCGGTTHNIYLLHRPYCSYFI